MMCVQVLWCYKTVVHVLYIYTPMDSINPDTSGFASMSTNFKGGERNENVYTLENAQLRTCVHGYVFTSIGEPDERHIRFNRKIHPRKHVLEIKFIQIVLE